MKKKLKISTLIIFAAAFLCMLSFCNLAYSQVTLSISKKFGERTKVAVAPFTGNTYKSKQVSSLLQKNLEFSGFFQMVPNQSFVVDQQTQDIKKGFIDFKGWQALTAEILIKGNTIISGNTLKIEYEVFSPSDQKRIFGKGYQSNANEVQYIVNTITDDILKHLTGNPPIFSKKIAFTTDYYKTKTIVVSDIACKKRTRLFNEKTLSITPCWFTGEDKLAYVSYRKRNPAIYIIDLKTGKNSTAIHLPGLNVSPNISPDGRFIAFTASKDGNPEIYVKDLKTNHLLRVTNNRAVEGDPTISPDGRSVAFVSNRYGTPQIFIQKGNEKPQRITYDGRYNTSPVWNPKGDMIAYASMKNGRFNIYVYDFKERVSFPIVESRGNDENPDWAADGRHLIYQSDRFGRSNIYAVDIFTRQEIQITKDFGKCENPSWQK